MKIFFFRRLAPSPNKIIKIRAPAQSKPTPGLDQMLKREEHNLRMDEIRQRMEQEQELFQFKREMAEVELARAKVQLQISEQQLSSMKKRTVIAMQDDGSVVETIMI